MQRCADCTQEMSTARSCTRAAVEIRRIAYLRVRFGPEQQRRGRRCADCGVTRGGWHHLGCDVEPCPCCRAQLINCGCSDETTDARAGWPIEVAMRAITASFERRRRGSD